MELNVNYWGDQGGSYLVPSDFKWAGFAYGTAGQSLADLWRAGKITLNEQVDPSAFYCYSYASKIASYHYVSLINTSYSAHTIESDYHDSPFANYALGYRGYAYTSFINGGQSKTSAIGYDISDASGATQRILTRYALARMRFVCYVVYVSSYSHNTDDPAVLVLPTPNEIQLKDFLDNSQLMQDYEDENLIILGLQWRAYIKNDNSTLIGTLYDQIAPYSVNNFDMDNSTEQTGVHENKWYLPVGAGVLEQGGYMAGNSIGIGEVGHFCIPNTSDKWVIKICTISGSGRVFAQPCLKPSMLLDAFHEFAYVGITYTNNTTSAASKSFADENVFIPVISFGKTSGKYKQGNPNWSDDEEKAAVLQVNPPALNDTDPDDDPNPDYIGQDSPDSPGVDPNTQISSTPLNTPTLSTIGVFNRSFAMNAQQLQAFADWLYNADDDIYGEVIDGLRLMGENPMNGVVDVRLYPFDILDMVDDAGGELIKIGRTVSDVYGVKLSNSCNCVIDLGHCKFLSPFENFLDYEPYTTARLYIPYCGVVNINTAEFVGHDITAKLIVDIITGACVACIFVDDILTITANGTCGVSIPMTGTDSATYASQVLTHFAGAVSSIAGGLSGSVTDAAKGALMGGAELWKANSVPVQYETKGSATPACENWLPQFAYFIVDKPKTSIPNNYGHHVGWACEISDTLGNFSGFTIVSNPDLTGINATETEKEEIKRLLQEGVYL